MADHAPSDKIAPGEPPHHPHADPHAAHAPATCPFTDAELAQLHAEDFAAGKAVVMLMVGIFSTGVVLYTIVAASVIL
jgi:hypothetical protein